jgi:hypothetical protein
MSPLAPTAPREEFYSWIYEICDKPLILENRGTSLPGHFSVYRVECFEKTRNLYEGISLMDVCIVTVLGAMVNHAMLE